MQNYKIKTKNLYLLSDFCTKEVKIILLQMNYAIPGTNRDC